MKLSQDALNFMRELETRTGAVIKDCIVDEKDITIVVREGDLGLVVGKKGSIIKSLKEHYKREIHAYEHSSDPQKFVTNLLYPVKVEKVEINGKTIKVSVNPEEKKRAIGKAGKKINTVKELAKRHFDVENIVVA